MAVRECIFTMVTGTVNMNRKTEADEDPAARMIGHREFLVNKIFSTNNLSTNMHFKQIQKQLRSGRNIFLVCTLLTLTVLVIAACQKTADKPFVKNGYDATAAKDWFYGSFKSSAEYKAYDKEFGGSKLPDWKNGRHVKLGDFDAMEFPLNKQKTKVGIPESAAVTEADRNRIAQATVSKVLFIKQGDKTLVREAEYIPDLDYLAAHQYDISQNGFGNVDKDFSGSIQINGWAGDEYSRLVLKNGKVQRRMHGNIILAANAPVGTGKVACNGVLITEYERECEIHIYSDNQVTLQCGEWYPTGNQWCYESEVANPCEDPASPQCACQQYGLCEGGDGNGGEESCDQRQQQLQGATDDATVAITLNSETQNSRVKYYDWTFYKQAFNLWKFVSHDKGVHVKDNGFWKWESLTHESISRVGTVLGGTITCTLNSAQSTHTLAFATLTLNYSITASLICAGSPLSWSNDYTSVKMFNINE